MSGPARAGRRAGSENVPVCGPDTDRPDEGEGLARARALVLPGDGHDAVVGADRWVHHVARVVLIGYRSRRRLRAARIRAASTGPRSRPGRCRTSALNLSARTPGVR